MANANDVKVKPIPVTFDEVTEIEGSDGRKVRVVKPRERTLFFDFNALIELEEIYGSVSEALSGIEKLKMKNIRDMIWAGLLHEDEELTRKQVGKMLNVGNMDEVTLKITEAMGTSLPDPENIEKKPGE